MRTLTSCHDPSDWPYKRFAFSLDCSRLTGHSTAIFEFAMSAEWFDNSLIVRHLANEETSAKGSQPYG
jgi:hypothetical protein